jgi:glutaminyl-peptide cyclotransferase
VSHLDFWHRSRLAALGAALLATLSGGANAALPVYGFQVVATYPHDTRAYTQGLFYLDGSLFESTGQVGQSNIRRVRLKDGVVLQSQAISPSMFGEGMVNWGQELISVTWQDRVGFRWDLKTLALKSTFSYPGEGWALTQNGVDLILSDGTPVVRFLDPRTFRERRRIRVTAEGRPVSNLNEIEWVNGEIFGNIWQTNLIARINPKTGAVKGWIDLTGLPETLRRRDQDAVANGIAYDAKLDRLFVTGKYWPRLYEIDLKPKGVAR